MGCDIHLYVEYKSKDSGHWRSFGKRFNPGRYYGIFAMLAGVRNEWGLQPVSEPKGIPDDIAPEAFEDYTIFICEGENANYVTKERAEGWVNSGSSKYMRERFVSSPDWHSESWCTSSELKAALVEVFKTGLPAIEYHVIYKVMKEFEDNGYDCRCVFWFDN